MAMSDNTNLVWKMFKDLGYSDIATSALVGNMVQESTTPNEMIDPLAENEEENAHGILQWRNTSGKNKNTGVSWDSPRIQWLQKFADENFMDVNDLRTQVLFADWELKNKFKGAYNNLKKSKNIEDATTIVDRDYVYSLGTTRGKRIRNAIDIFNQFQGLGSNEVSFPLEPIEANASNLNSDNESSNMDNNSSNLGFGNSSSTGTKETFIEKLKNPDNLGRLARGIALATNSARIDPDPDMARNFSAIEERELMSEKRNRTAQVLAQMGHGDIAKMVAEGTLNAGEALRIVKQPNNLRAFQEAKEQGLIPENMTYSAFVQKQAGVPTMVDQVGMEAWKVYSEATGEVDTKKGQIDLLMSLASDGIFSGALAEPQLYANKLMQTFGLTSSETNNLIGNTEAFQAFSSKMILDMMGGSLGAGFSEGDRQFVVTMSPNLGMTKEGILKVGEYMDAMLKRRIYVQNKLLEFLGSEDKNYSDWQTWAYEFAENNPIFPRAIDIES